MRLKELQVRTRAQANLILANNGDFQDQCHSCGQKFGHHVVYHSDVKAYFLNCGRCGEEMFEIDKRKVTKG
jgi:transcription elongation factor Elf1